ncbi:MAG: GAF domain-containing protein [Anaerolineales bacterium]|nr:GAF domain-containing protein [Anaerolineales bacterium]
MPFVELDQRLLDALASLNQIGEAMNHIGQDGAVSVETALKMIVESATRVVPGASAVIYSYDARAAGFDLDSRVSAGEWDQSATGDQPRPAGLGAQAIRQRRRVLSQEDAGAAIHPVRAQAGAKSMCAFPLIVAAEPVGVLYVYLLDERPFSQLELLMLDNFVNLAAMAIYHAHHLARMQKNLSRKEDELNRLRRAGLLISSRLRLDDTLTAILQMALEVTGAQYGIFRLLDPSGEFLNMRALAGEQLNRPLVEALPLTANSVMSWVARNRQPICIADLEQEPWSQIYYPLDAGLQMRSELAVPLIGASARLEGVLNLESPLVAGFGEDDSHLLQALATQAVIAIQEVRLLDALQEVARLLLSQPCQKVLQHLAKLACDLLGASASSIWSLRGQDLVPDVSFGGCQPGERIPLTGSLTGEVVRSGQALLTHDLCAEERFHPLELPQSQNWSQALIVPLLAGDGGPPLGAFSVYGSNALTGHFGESEWDKKVLVCLADYAVLAYQNAARQEALLAAQEQRAIAETFAAVGDIASNLLHHLNNKVGTIPVRIQGIADKCEPVLAANPYLAHNLDEIERCAAEAMQSVRDNLLHLRPIRLEPLQVASHIQEAINASQLPPGLLVNCEALDGLPLVMAGGSTLVLLFTNLFENAANALGGPGKIEIKGKVDGKWVEISVSDDGPGIPPRFHEHIFELDFSGRGASRPGKLGFGLWWVKTLMTRLGGSVTVESDGLRGTVFRLRLPCAEAQERDQG